MTEPSASASSHWISTLLCWTVILGITGYLTFAHARADHAKATKPAAAANDAPPAIDLVLTGRMAVGLSQSASMTDALRAQLRHTLDDQARRPIDRLAVATVVRELFGKADAVRFLNANDFTATPRLQADAATLSTLYREDAPATLTDAQRADLLRDLGYFGRLAVTQAGPADAPDRLAVLAEATRTWITVTVAGALGLLVFVVGCVGFVTLCVLFGVGTLRLSYTPPSTDRPVWLEAFAMWMAAFILFSLAIALVAHRLKVEMPMVATELLVAGLTAAIAVGWPMWRGKMSFASVRQTLGWHAGQGLLIEVAAGIAGYVAGLPVLAVGVALTLGLGKLVDAHPSHPITREFGDHVTSGHALALFVTAAVLAPLLEETIFRGSLYGHLRRRHRVWLSMAIVAFIFAAIHPQGWTTIPILGSIAIVLAFLREWRGSLIASMTGHAINNGVIVAVILLALR